MTTQNIGYMKMVEQSPSRVWEVYDKDGKRLDRGNCMQCTITAGRYGMAVVRVH